MLNITDFQTATPNGGDAGSTAVLASGTSGSVTADRCASDVSTA